MSLESFSTNWYFTELPRLQDVLKTEIITRKQQKEAVTVEDYLTIFFDFVENYNAFQFFEKGLVKEDRFYLSISFKFGRSTIDCTRRFWLNPDFDETFFETSYEVSLDVDLNVTYDHESFEESFEIHRDKNDQFFSYQTKIDFTDFRNRVLTNSNLGPYLQVTPCTVRNYIRLDV